MPCEPFEEGRRMAAGVPGSHFVALEGSDRLILGREPAWPRLLDEVDVGFSITERRNRQPGERSSASQEFFKPGSRSSRPEAVSVL